MNISTLNAIKDERCNINVPFTMMYVCFVNEVSFFALKVHPDLSRQLLQDGYRLDEIPDDEDLDLIPPKALGSSVCCCSEGPSCSMQWCWFPDSDVTLTKASVSDLSHWWRRPSFLSQIPVHAGLCAQRPTWKHEWTTKQALSTVTPKLDLFFYLHFFLL